MKMLYVFLFLSLTMIVAAPTSYTYTPPAGYSLVWQDEFDGITIDTNKWNLETTCSPNNNEAQCYTSDTTSAAKNAFVADGKLNIVARQRPATNANNNKIFTSARLVSQVATASFKYGTFVAKIKGATGQGVWPAFWLLGTITNGHSWPWVGEIDILEYRGGSDPGGDDYNSMTLHYARGHNTVFTGDVNAQHVYYGRSIALQNAAKWGDAYHIYECLWSPTEIRGYIDGVEFFYINSVSTDHFNEFNSYAQAMNIILNLAIGGDFNAGKTPPLDANYANTMYIDWVRVYQQTPATIAGIVAAAPVVPGAPTGATGTVAYVANKAPTQIAQRGTFSITVTYTVSHATMIVCELITKDSSTKYGAGSKMVNAGSGQTTMILAINREVPIGATVEIRIFGSVAEGYFHNIDGAYLSALNGIIAQSVTVGTTYIYPTGASNIALPNPEGIVDTAAPTSTPANITPNTPSLSLTSYTPFSVSVTYTASEQSVILVDVLHNTLYSKPASGTLTVAAGTKVTVSVPMTWLQGETGTTYFYNFFLIPKSQYDSDPTTAYQRASDTKRVDNVVINAATTTPPTQKVTTAPTTATPTQKVTTAPTTATTTTTPTSTPTSTTTTSPITTPSLRINNAPLSVVNQMSSLYINVTYTTNVESVILVDLLHATLYSKPATGNVVAPIGSGITTTISLKWIDGAIPGATYFYNVFLIRKSLYDADSLNSYQQALNATRIDNVMMMASTTTTSTPTSITTTTDAPISSTSSIIINNGQNLNIKWLQPFTVAVTYTVRTTSIILAELIHTSTRTKYATGMINANIANTGVSVDGRINIAWISTSNMTQPISNNIFELNIYMIDNDKYQMYMDTGASMYVTTSTSQPKIVIENTSVVLGNSAINNIHMNIVSIVSLIIISIGAMFYL